VRASALRVFANTQRYYTNSGDISNEKIKKRIQKAGHRT